MPNLKIGTRIGTFLDEATQQEAGFSVFGSFDYQSAPGKLPTASELAPLESQIRMELLQAAKSVLGAMLAEDQSAVPTLIHLAPPLVGEIVAASGVEENFSVKISKVELTVSRDKPAA